MIPIIYFFLGVVSESSDGGGSDGPFQHWRITKSNGPESEEIRFTTKRRKMKDSVDTVKLVPVSYTMTSVYDGNNDRFTVTEVLTYNYAQYPSIKQDEKAQRIINDNLKCF